MVVLSKWWCCLNDGAVLMVVLSKWCCCLNDGAV